MWWWCCWWCCWTKKCSIWFLLLHPITWLGRGTASASRQDSHQFPSKVLKLSSTLLICNPSNSLRELSIPRSMTHFLIQVIDMTDHWLVKAQNPESRRLCECPFNASGNFDVWWFSKYIPSASIVKATTTTYAALSTSWMAIPFLSIYWRTRRFVLDVPWNHIPYISYTWCSHQLPVA